jgi:hypothetical protein
MTKDKKKNEGKMKVAVWNGSSLSELPIVKIKKDT